MRNRSPGSGSSIGTREHSSPSTTSWRRTVTHLLLVALTAAAALATLGTGTAAAGDADDAEQQLAERFAPRVMVRQQDDDCDTDGEPFEPAPVEIVLDNPEVFLRQVGNGDPVAMRAPGPSDLFDLREGWYLEFPGDALEPGCIFEQDFRRFWDGRSVTYAHVATEADHPGQLALQYWFFWYHNPAKNDHEGDWEFVQLLFDVATVEEALTATPVSAGYAQHEGGERSDWDDPKLERVGDRPVVYAAKGSHASYFGSALHLGRSGHEGFGCDNTDGPSRALDPDVVLLPDAVDDPDDPLAWLAFQGRWGQREAGFFNGPTGPFAKGRWTEPVAWESGLRDASVVIPGGDQYGNAVLTTFCSVVEFGSTVLVTGLRSPGLLLVVAIGLVLTVAAVARRTTWSPVVTAGVRRRRAYGQTLRAAVRVWRDHPMAMVWIGLVYVPVTLVTSMMQAAIMRVPFVDDLIGLAGTRDEIAVLLAIFVGGIGNVLAFSYVAAVVARAIVGDRTTSTPTLPAAEIRRLLGAVLRATAIVVGLLVSIVGIPWAIRQLVRYQVAPQAIVLEGADARTALRRSTELVQGRWWWTAGTVATIQVAIGIAGLMTAMIVLVTFTAIPLWLFNLLSSAILIVLVPVGAAAMAYVYGTLAARHDAQPAPTDTADLEPAPAP